MTLLISPVVQLDTGTHPSSPRLKAPQHLNPSCLFHIEEWWNLVNCAPLFSASEMMMTMKSSCKASIVNNMLHCLHSAVYQTFFCITTHVLIRHLVSRTSMFLRSHLNCLRVGVSMFAQSFV